MLKNTTLTAVEEYFRLLSLEASENLDEFWDHIIGRHEQKAYEFEELLSSASKENQRKVYPIKNQDLAFSLDVAKMVADFYLAYCKWVSDAPFQPKRILDVGCDNGILTCFYAFLYPEAQVVGIDRTKEGIRCARELAKTLGLTNISFRQLDYREVDQYFNSHSFDMITSVRVFHEILSTNPAPIYWSVEDFLNTAPLSSDYKYLEVIRQLLTEDGVYLSTERLETSAALGQWANMLEATNLFVTWDRSSFIEFHETGATKKSPIVVATKSPTAISTIEGLKMLYLRNVDFEQFGSYSSGVAEILFHQLAPKRLVKGTLIVFEDHWYQVRYEIWTTDTFILVYGCGNMGYRKLEILPLLEMEQAYSTLAELANEYAEEGILTHYTTNSEREASLQAT